jgi:hypothetical protein
MEEKMTDLNDAIADLERLEGEMPKERRARLVSAQIQFLIVLDDGEEFEPVSVQPITVPAKAWPPNVDEILAQVEAEMLRRPS